MTEAKRLKMKKIEVQKNIIKYKKSKGAHLTQQRKRITVNLLAVTFTQIKNTNCA